MKKPSDWILKRAREIYKETPTESLDSFVIATGCTIQAILDYLDKPTPREDCFRCHNLPEGAVVSGHDHGNLNPLLPPLGTVT